jgi:hypothetical protein
MVRANIRPFRRGATLAVKEGVMKLAARSICIGGSIFGFALCLAGCFDLSALTSGTRPPAQNSPDFSTTPTGSPAPPDLATTSDDLSVPLDLEPPIVRDLSGACALPSDEDKICDPTTNPCKTPGLCKAGVCQPQGNANAGVVCNKASDACHTDGTCNGSGSCGAQGTRAEKYNWDTNNALARCCGGHPTTVDTAENCGACGINCNGGSCVTAHGGHLYCTCGSNNQCLLRAPGATTGCCSTYYGNPWVCAAGNCVTNQMIQCPGGATNSTDANGPFYCHY